VARPQETRAVSILGRYLVGFYLRAFVLCLAGAVGLLLVVDFFQRIGDFATYDADASLVAAYFAMRIPKMLADVYPAAALFAALLSIGSLVRTSEVQAMHACGISVFQIARPLVVTSVCISVIALLWNETVVPPMAARARTVKNIGIKGLRERGLLDASSLWFQVPEGFLNIEYFDAAREILHGVTLHAIDPNFQLRRVVEVPQATWQRDHWKLSQGTVRIFGDAGAFDFRPLVPADLTLSGTPAEFSKRTPRADEFNARELAERIRVLKSKGLDPAEYQVDLQFKLAMPLSGVITVLLGVPLALRGSRRGGMAQYLGTGLTACFAYWLTQALTVSAGHADALPPLVAAWAANVLFVLIGGLLALRT